MKLITLNTHSLAEPDYENKLKLFARAVLRETPDVIALQEVNQSVDEEPVGTEQLRECGFTQCREVELESGEAAGRGPDGCGEMRKIGAGDCKGQAEHGVGDWGGNVPVRADNHAFRLAGLLAEGGMPCFWTWVPAKIGYGRYDEGTALFSRRPIAQARWFYLTGTRDYNNWKTRKALEICVEESGRQRRFFSLHMGWWGDEEEPFARGVPAGWTPMSWPRAGTAGSRWEEPSTAGVTRRMGMGCGWILSGQAGSYLCRSPR